MALDFVRMSVDHGTAPDIAYTNKADYRGCLFVIKEALKGSLVDDSRDYQHYKGTVYITLKTSQSKSLKIHSLS